MKHVIYKTIIVAIAIVLSGRIASAQSPPAARLGDPTSHGGSIVTGFSTVLIGGMPAARLGDEQVCPMVNPGPVPHVGGPILTGSSVVLIGGMPAARVGDIASCVGPSPTIAMGCPTVLIGSDSRSSSAIHFPNHRECNCGNHTTTKQDTVQTANSCPDTVFYHNSVLVNPDTTQK